MPHLHVVSVHYMNPRWVPIQRHYLDRFIDVPHTRYFSVEGIPFSHFREGEVTVSSTDHYLEKFEELVQLVYAHASGDDWVLFIDSDAFPLSAISPLMESGYSLTGVQRLENGDFHPHPCFTLTRVDQWRELGERNWDAGTWITASGVPATEMGGVLLSRLRSQGLEWSPLLRMNVSGLHPLWFGVYGSESFGPVVYHHGAGSRRRVSRADHIPRSQRVGRAIERVRWLSAHQRGKRLGITRWQAVRNYGEQMSDSVLEAIEAGQDMAALLLDPAR